MAATFNGEAKPPAGSMISTQNPRRIFATGGHTPTNTERRIWRVPNPYNRRSGMRSKCLWNRIMGRFAGDSFFVKSGSRVRTFGHG